MFIEEHQRVPLAFAHARRALESTLTSGHLAEDSYRAVDEGVAFLMRVGPAGSGRVPTKKVLVQALHPEPMGHAVVVPFRWEATGATGRLFPVLDANLTLADAGNGTSTLSIIASYRPPLGGITAGLDRVVLSRAAGATLSALLREIAARLVADAATAAPVAQQGPTRPE